jgi:OOP family OmpA-OmpF porin
MKKLVFAMLILISSGFLFAQKQKPEFNRWSLDLNAGLNKTVRNFAPGYSSGLADFGEVNVGARYMFNAYAGLKLGLVFDRFRDGKDSPDFATNMGRLSLDGVVNVGNALKFYQWTDRLGLLFHAGIGVGNFVDQGFPLFSSTIDKVGSITFGLTPQFKLNDKWSINLDASVVGLARIHHSFDYSSNGTLKNGTSRGFNGQFFTGTIGVSYYLGKKKSHADWSPTK